MNPKATANLGKSQPRVFNQPRIFLVNSTLQKDI